SQCIWCLQSAGGKHVEHIVPEALGCPKGFVLTADQICQRCNNGLGYLDQAVADDFDFVGFLAGVTRKKRKAPGIMSRGNVYGFLGRDGPEIIFNMNATPMTARNGEHIAGYRGSARNIKASIHETGSSARITFESTIGTSKKFQRGIYKIAISS